MGEIQQDNRRYSNPSASSDDDASEDTTKSNPLLAGKKEVQPMPEPKEWGSLRKGIAKDDPAYGLPEQQNPRANYDPNGNDSNAGGGTMASQQYTTFPKSRERPVDDVMAKPPG